MVSHCVDRNHFISPVEQNAARALFKTSVQVVHLEITAYCNRRCSYCPVSTVDRSSALMPMDDAIFFKVLPNLVEIEFAGRVNFNLYNEPTADQPLLLSRTRQVRDALPNASICFNSNGDYLTPNYLKALSETGVKRINVTLHGPAGQPFDTAVAITRFTEFAARIGKSVQIDHVILGVNIEGHLSYGGLYLLVVARDFHKVGTDRGGLIANCPHPVRTAPCSRPFTDLTISYDGTVFPCCQLFADSHDHKDRYAIGNLTEFPDIFALYTSSQMAVWRLGLLTDGPKEAPCDSCNEINCHATISELVERERLLLDLLETDPKLAPSTHPQ
jgi:hypothetical protein